MDRFGFQVVDVTGGDRLFKVSFTPAPISEEELEVAFTWYRQNVLTHCGHYVQLFDLTTCPSNLSTHLWTLVQFFQDAQKAYKGHLRCTLVVTTDMMLETLIACITQVVPPTRPVHVLPSPVTAHLYCMSDPEVKAAYESAAPVPAVAR